MQPVPPQERNTLIDALRGTALAGIILANVRGFSSPMEVYFQPQLMWNSAGDRTVQFLLDCLVSGKFMAIFAILFGLGFGIQFERARARGESLTRVYLRRMFWLLLAGVAHVALLWWGDILMSYAAMGFLLPLFQDQPQEELLRWALVLYWFPVFAILGFAALAALGAPPAPVVPDASAEAIRQAVEIYTRGSWIEMFHQRLAEWQRFNASAYLVLPRVLGFFLFGLWLWREKVLQQPDRHIPAIRRALPWLAVIGGAGNAGFVTIHTCWNPDPMAPGGLGVAMWLLASVGIPALSLFYIGCLVLAHQSIGVSNWLDGFRYVGRTALTNYLAQSLIGTAIFYGFGLGLYGRVGPLGGLALALGIYAGQVWFSKLWLTRFRWGPAEWVWRSLTYGRLAPRRAPVSRRR